MSEAPRILIVDDEPGVVQSLRRIMHRLGYDVTTAVNGTDAIEVAGEVKGDGMLMDIRMPGMNGLETSQRTRIDCPDAFVCFMTCHSELMDEAATERRSHVLSKPVNVELMCELIARETARTGRNLCEDGRIA